MIDKNEQRLDIVAFWFALSSVALGIMPVLILCALIYSSQGKTSFAGLAGFSVCFLIPMWLGSLLSWLISLVMMTIIAFSRRRLLHTRIGITTMLIQAGILVCIGAIVLSVIKR
jgi:hypothetical protein